MKNDIKKIASEEFDELIDTMKKIAETMLIPAIIMSLVSVLEKFRPLKTKTGVLLSKVRYVYRGRWIFMMAPMFNGGT